MPSGPGKVNNRRSTGYQRLLIHRSECALFAVFTVLTSFAIRTISVAAIIRGSVARLVASNRTASQHSSVALGALLGGCWQGPRHNPASVLNVFLAESTPAENRDTRLFLARYLKRSPLSLERTTLIESTFNPTIRLTKILDDGELHRDLSPLEFLAELQQHIPDMWEQTTRYFGYPKYRAPPPLHKTNSSADRTIEPVWDEYDQSSFS